MSIEHIKISTAQFHEDIESLKLKYQTELNEKQAHLERAMAELQSQPQLEQFIKETLDVNTMLKKEQEIFYHQASMIDSYCDSNKIMIQQIAIQKLECERLEKKIEEHIQWQIPDIGKQANLPQIDKLHKELLFAEWRAQINQAEKEATKTSKKSNEII